MESQLFFRGKKITERERKLLAEVFEEKIDDLYLCQSILLAAMRPENVLARAAFTRALTHKYCSYTDGGREARKLIRRVRRKLGYRLSFSDRMGRLRQAGRNLSRSYAEHDEQIWSDVADVLTAGFKIIFFFVG
jgi:hypothetical protein